MAQNATMESALALGMLQNDTQQALDIFVQQTLNKASINASVHVFQTQEAALNAVAEGKIAVFACPLQSVPTTLPLGLVITTLTERKAANNCLIAKHTEGVIFSEKENLKILTLSSINCAQMRYLQPNSTVVETKMSPNDGLELVRSGEYDAVVLGEWSIDKSDFSTDEWFIQAFSVREFVPLAGQGVVCFITAEDDLPTRRLLKSAHHPSVSVVTNIERTIQKLLETHEVTAYCERDRMGNYHLWAAALVNNELRKTRVSQSTSFGMAEKAVEQLLSA